MAMEISNNYSNYASSYANAADNKKKQPKAALQRKLPQHRKKRIPKIKAVC